MKKLKQIVVETHDHSVDDLEGTLVKVKGSRTIYLIDKKIMDCDSNVYSEESTASPNDSCHGCGMKQWRATRVGTTKDYDPSIRQKVKTVVSSFGDYAFA